MANHRTNRQDGQVQRSIEFNQVYSCLRFAWRFRLSRPDYHQVVPNNTGQLCLLFLENSCLVALYKHIEKIQWSSSQKEWRQKIESKKKRRRKNSWNGREKSGSCYHRKERTLSILFGDMDRAEAAGRALSFRLHAQKFERGQHGKKITRVWSISSRPLSSD